MDSGWDSLNFKPRSTIYYTVTIRKFFNTVSISFPVCQKRVNNFHFLEVLERLNELFLSVCNTALVKFILLILWLDLSISLLHHMWNKRALKIQNCTLTVNSWLYLIIVNIITVSLVSSFNLRNISQFTVSLAW